MISSVYTGMIIVTMGNDALIALQDTKQHTHTHTRHQFYTVCYNAKLEGRGISPAHDLP